MGTAVLLVVLLVAGVGVPLLALAVDRRFSRSAWWGRPSSWKPPAVDLGLEQYRLASRHGLTFEQMQALSVVQASEGEPPVGTLVLVAQAFTFWLQVRMRRRRYAGARRTLETYAPETGPCRPG